MPKIPPKKALRTSRASAAEVPSTEIQAIDELFRYAGLTRNMRGKAGGVTKRMRLERSAPQEIARRSALPRVAKNGVQWLPVPGWERLKWLHAGFSTRRGGLSRVYCAEGAEGELNLSFTEVDDRKIVGKNRRLLAEAVSGSTDTPLVPVRQVHSSVVVRVGEQDAHRELPWKGDGVICSDAGLLIGVQTADCIPVLVADRKKRVVAAFHAGWRGTVKRIVENGIGRMRLEFGSKPEDLIAAIGPGIGPCCYGVGEEVFTEFESQFAYFQKLFHDVYDSDPIRMKYPMLFLTQCAPGHSPIGPSLHLDLVEANRQQLLAAGIGPKSIQIVGGCTACQPELFFSHRASRGYTGRLMAVIGMQ